MIVQMKAILAQRAGSGTCCNNFDIALVIDFRISTLGTSQQRTKKGRGKGEVMNTNKEMKGSPKVWAFGKNYEIKSTSWSSRDKLPRIWKEESIWVLSFVRSS